MDQSKANKLFKTKLGWNVNKIYSTPDDAAFVHYDDAYEYCMLNNLNVESIKEWQYNEK